MNTHTDVPGYRSRGARLLQDVTRGGKPIEAIESPELRRCKCGELELSGIEIESGFGWFTSDEGTFCQRCGRRQR